MILLTAMLLAAAPVSAEASEQYNEAQAIRRTQPARARSLYERAARLGHPQAQASLGIMLLDDGKREAALPWLRAASEQGEPGAMLLWGTALFNGDGVQPNRVLGYLLVARAARALPAAESTRSEMDLVMTPAERRAALTLDSPPPVTAQITARPTPPLCTCEPLARTKQVASSGALTRAQASVRPSGTWRLQLGAFRLNGSAERLFARLAPQLPGKQPSFLPLGDMTRLLVGPYGSKAAALTACRALGPGQACFPVASR